MSLPKTTQEYHLPQRGLENLSVRESLVHSPKFQEVLVKVHAVSLNYRDLAIVTGEYPGQMGDIVPCSDLAGEVIAVGEDVTTWKIGDRVSANFSVNHVYGDPTNESVTSALGGGGGTMDGTLTQFKILPAHSLVHIPSHLSYEEAATLPCAGVTAWNALLGPVPLKGGDYVLVLGTGGVSVFALQFAVAMGATVIATSSSNAKLEFVKKLGAHHTINYKDTPDWDKEVLRITGGRGVDHVIEVGGTGTLPKSIRSTRKAGCIHNIGFLSKEPSDTSRLLASFLFGAIIYRSVLVGSRQQFEEMSRLIEARQIKPVVSQVFGFKQAREAYEYLQSQKHIGKIVITLFD
ncbi:NAD(P)-binding protein [Abortiporus biennis]|nr:NAD(P)-binding protein [Abortiporus biennis]